MNLDIKRFLPSILLHFALALCLCSQAIAGSAEECIRYLRDIAYNETIVTSSSDIKQTLRYAICTTSFHSRSEAQKAGLEVGLTLFDVPFEANGDLDTSSFEVWKTTNCSDLAAGFNSVAESMTLTRVVSPEATAIFNSCVSASGLFCAITSPSPEIINVQLNWTPYPGSDVYTTVRSSTVVNARSLEPRTPANQLVPVKYLVPFGGATVQLTRADVRRPVSVTVNTDNGSCPLLNVQAEGDVTAQIEISGTAEYKGDGLVETAIEIENAACGTKKAVTQEVCAPFPIDTSTIINEKSDCGHTAAANTISGGCSAIQLNVNGCAFKREQYQRTKCWMEGINHSRPRRVCGEETATRDVCQKTSKYTATAVLKGVKWEERPIPTFVSTKTGRNGVIAFSYDSGLLAGGTVRNISYVYRVVVTFPGPDGRPTIVQLDSGNPMKTVGGSTIRSALDSVHGTVLIFVEGVRTTDNLTEVNSDYTVDVQPEASVTFTSEDVEDFDLELFNSDGLKQLGLPPAEQ